MRSSSVSSASGLSASASATSRRATSGAAQRPLAVGEDGAVALVAAHPPVGAELAGGLGVVAGVVRGHADGLADRSDAGRAVAGGTGVRERGLRVLVDERSRRRRGGRRPGRRCAGRGPAGRRGPAGSSSAASTHSGCPGRAAAADDGPRGRAPGRSAPGRPLPVAGRAGRSCQLPPDAAVAHRHAAGGHPGGGGPATAGGRPSGRSPWAAGGPPTGHEALGRSPVGRSPCGTAVLPVTTRRPGRAGDGQPVGRSPWGRRSCHCGRSPVRPVDPGGRRSCRLRAVTRSGGHPADGGPATADGHRRGRSPPRTGGPARGTLGPAAQPTAAGGHPGDGGPATAGGHPSGGGPARPAGPLRTVTLRAVTLRAGGPATADGRPGGPVTTRPQPATAADGHPAGGHPGDGGPASHLPRADRTLRFGHPADGGPASRRFSSRDGPPRDDRRTAALAVTLRARAATAGPVRRNALRTTARTAGAAAGRAGPAGAAGVAVRLRNRGSSRGPSEPRRGEVMTSGYLFDMAAPRSAGRRRLEPDMKTRTGARAVALTPVR